MTLMALTRLKPKLVAGLVREGHIGNQGHVDGTSDGKELKIGGALGTATNRKPPDRR